MKLKADGQGLWDNAEGPKKVAKLNPDEEPAGSKTQPWFKLKQGSVIPAKRRSVKRMMFDCLVQSISRRPSVSGASHGPKKVAKLNPDEEPAGSKTQPWFKPKQGSVIPAKRRSVKRMMFDCLVQSISGRPSVSGASPSNSANGCPNKFPPPNHQMRRRVRSYTHTHHSMPIIVLLAVANNFPVSVSVPGIFSFKPR